MILSYITNESHNLSYITNESHNLSYITNDLSDASKNKTPHLQLIIEIEYSLTAKERKEIIMVELENFKPHTRRRLELYDKEGNFLQSFQNTLDAAEILNLSKYAVSAYANDGAEHKTYSFKWNKQQFVGKYTLTLLEYTFRNVNIVNNTDVDDNQIKAIIFSSGIKLNKYITEFSAIYEYGIFTIVNNGNNKRITIDGYLYE